MASLSPLWVKITDFGISKRWAGTALKTYCGTPLYQAPELIGLLPRHMKTGRQVYSWGVDMWALGAVVHQVLTGEIPFLEIDLPSDDSTVLSTEVSIDGELLLNYCAGRSLFPMASLTMHGASADAVDFIKSLMVPDPKDRASAESALQSPWLRDIASRTGFELAGPSGNRFTAPVVEGEHEMGGISGRALLPQTVPRDSMVPHNNTPNVISTAKFNRSDPAGVITLSSQLSLRPPRPQSNPASAVPVRPSRRASTIGDVFSRPGTSPRASRNPRPGPTRSLANPPVEPSPLPNTSVEANLIGSINHAPTSTTNHREPDLIIIL